MPLGKNGSRVTCSLHMYLQYANVHVCCATCMLLQMMISGSQEVRVLTCYKDNNGNLVR